MAELMNARDIRYQGAIVDRGRLLVLRCVPRDGPPFWVLPGGGLEGAESPEACVAREVLEEAGVEENVRMARLGHVTKSMARRYTQPSATRDRAAAEALGRVIRG